MSEVSLSPGAAPRNWASTRRRRWNAPRIVAALLLHLLVLTAIVIGSDRVELRRGVERATTLVEIRFDRLPSPPPAPSPAPAIDSTARPHGASSSSATTARVPMRATPARTSDPVSQPIHLPTFDAPTVAIAATPPASAPSAPLPDLLDTTATRAAIRDAARGTRLSERANAATHEDAGSELAAADGSRCETCTRNLAPSRNAPERLAQGVAGASRPDCLKMSSGAGLLALPALVYGEATGRCGN